MAILSLATSALTTAYASTTLSYDFDTEVIKRRRSPKQFGMVPDEGRGFVFFVMVLISTFQIGTKTFATALLAATNPIWLTIFITMETVAFYVYKLFMKDLIYYIPLEGAIKFFFHSGSAFS